MLYTHCIHWVIASTYFIELNIGPTRTKNRTKFRQRFHVNVLSKWHTLGFIAHVFVYLINASIWKCTHGSVFDFISSTRISFGFELDFLLTMALICPLGRTSIGKSNFLAICTQKFLDVNTWTFEWFENQWALKL